MDNVDVSKEENNEMDNYNKAYKEVDTILSYMPEENVNQIPENMRNMFKEKMDKNHEFVIDETKPFEAQVMLPETMAILANLFRDFWATPEQRAMIIESEKEEIKKIQASEKQYDAKDMFSKLERENDEAHKNLNNSEHEEVSDKVEEVASAVPSEAAPASDEESKTLPVEKKSGFFQSIINWFKNLFGKKSS